MKWDKVCHLPSASVASDQEVMVGFHFVMLELAIRGDVDPLSIEHQAIFLSPFLTAQALASVQYLQCSDN